MLCIDRFREVIWNMSNEDRLTQDDLNMVIYFHESYGDITRWIKWEERKPIVQRVHPELIKAMEDVKVAHRILNAVVDSFRVYNLDPEDNG